jgi:hypothetical protein
MFDQARVGGWTKNLYAAVKPERHFVPPTAGGGHVLCFVWKIGFGSRTLGPGLGYRAMLCQLHWEPGLCAAVPVFPPMMTHIPLSIHADTTVTVAGESFKLESNMYTQNNNIIGISNSLRQPLSEGYSHCFNASHIKKKSNSFQLDVIENELIENDQTRKVKHGLACCHGEPDPV